MLFRPGSPCAGWLRVLSGTIRVSLTGSGGREITLYRVRPGEVCLQTFTCLAQGCDYAAEGVVEEALTAELLPAAGFADALGEPAFRAEVLGAVAARFGQLEGLVERVAFAGLDARLAAALLDAAGPDGMAHTTHDQLAVDCGSAREAVSRKLKQLSGEGLVEVARGHVRLVQPAALRRLAAGDAGL